MIKELDSRIYENTFLLDMYHYIEFHEHFMTFFVHKFELLRSIISFNYFSNRFFSPCKKWFDVQGVYTKSISNWGLKRSLTLVMVKLDNLVENTSTTQYTYTLIKMIS